MVSLCALAGSFFIFLNIFFNSEVPLPNGRTPPPWEPGYAIDGAAVAASLATWGVAGWELQVG